MLTLNKCQGKAQEQIVQWYKDKTKYLLTLGGYAGTGKTTLIEHIINDLRPLNVAFCAFTGKAALVLKTKLNLQFGDHCGTIHSLIYEPCGKINGRMTFRKKEFIDFDLIVVDEASMVDERIFGDLTSFHIPILAVGDHGQLPPVSGKFNLMENPEVRLEEIMRQDQDNPIVRLATMARKDGYIPFGEYGQGVSKISGMNKLKENLTPETMVICAKNKTRININSFIREMRGFEGDPKVNEQIICLKNNRDFGIFNGMIGKVLEVRHGEKVSKIKTDHPFEGAALKSQFGFAKTKIEDAYNIGVELFDYAYCITAHKSQGSEFDKVILLEERMGFFDDETWRRWLYTAVTRAKKELLIIKR